MLNITNHQRHANQNHTLGRMIVTKKSKITNVKKDVEKGEPLNTIVGDTN